MNADTPTDLSQAVVPGLLRRFAAMLYDLLLLAGVLLMATALIVLPFGIDTGKLPAPQLLLFQAYLIIVILAFFCWPWMKSGQTLGMKAWRIRLLRDDGQNLTLKDALFRLAASLLSWLPAGMGYFWALGDRDSLTWHDRLTKTRPVLLNRSS